ncbi:hypothetical protein AB0L06_43390 [Spirillospora sp. NPDC052269]
MTALLKLVEQRMHARGVSWTQITTTLGVHAPLTPRRPANTTPPYPLHFGDVPLNVIVALAQLLDLPVQAFLPEPDPVPHHGDQPPTDPATTTTAPDAVIVIAALAHAAIPLAADALADALGWPHDRLTAAVTHLRTHPHLAAAHALDGTLTSRLSVHLRLDLLTADQHNALRDAPSTQNGLTVRQAATLCVLAQADGLSRDHLALAPFLEQHQHHITELQHRGIVTTGDDLDYGNLDDAVRYSLGIKDPSQKHLRTPRWLPTHPDPTPEDHDDHDTPPVGIDIDLYNW